MTFKYLCVSINGIYGKRGFDMENEKRINDFFSKIKNKNLNNDDDVYTELITFERDDNLRLLKVKAFLLKKIL